jgi:outer membrane protein
MKRKKNILTLVLVILASFVLAGCAGEKETIGVVDLNKIMTESSKINELREQFNNKGKEISNKLEQEKEGLTEEEFQKRQETLYADFMKIRQDVETQMQQSITKAVEDVSKEKKISVVLFKDGVAHGGVDVTEDVLKKLQQ